MSSDSVPAAQTTNDTAVSSQAANDRVLADAVAKVSGNAEPASAPDLPAGSATSGESKVRVGRVIQPLNDVNESKPDIHELIAKEEANEQANEGTPIPVSHTPDSTINPATGVSSAPASPQT